MRTHFGYWLFRLALVFMTAAPAFADDDKDKSEPVVHATPAMWVVHGPKGTAYLLGSVHALPKNVQWQTPAIKAAVKRADTFVFEINMSSENLDHTGLLMAENKFLPPSVSLPSYFDSEMRSDFRAAIEHTQIDPEGLVGLRPWYAAMELEDAMSGKLTLHTEEGVDNKIYAMAQARGVRDVRALETPELALHALKRDANTKNELGILRAAMKKAANKPMVSFKKLLEAWEAGDTAAIQAVNVAAESPEEHKALLYDRNHNWLPKIEKMLNEKRTFFITVGAAHLAGGPDSVPNLLRQAGYKVDGPDLKPDSKPDLKPGARS
ncbi:MAG TPA: TraB/GumN family protein [Rhizomicrobium sp.]|nr:TraB/GumN family protein [Rhizomicrobium sp.]